MSITRDLIIYGAGGLGIEIVSMAESHCHAGRDTWQWKVLGFVDDSPHLWGQSIHGVPCLGSLASVIKNRAGLETHCHIAIGDNLGRLHASKRMAYSGWHAATVIHHSAYVSWEVDIGSGTFISPHCTVSPNVRMGRHSLINTRACIGHHAVLGDFSQISLGASVLGHARIETGAMVGAHGVVMSGITVGDWATVAVGTPVLRHVKAGHTVSLPLAKNNVYQ